MITKKQNQEILNALENKINKSKVKKILGQLEVLPQDELCDENNMLDLKKVHARPEVIEAIKKFKRLGVTKEYLRENFIVASLIFGNLL